VLNRRRKIAIGIVSVVVLAGGTVGVARYHDTRRHGGHAGAEYFCPMHPSIVRDKPGECPICGMKLEKRETPGASPAPRAALPSGERRILFYRHPMDPSIHSDKPAKDSMGMDYVPVYADETSEASVVPGRVAVKIPAQNAQLLGIRSEPVGSGFKGGVLRTVGRVAVAETGREAVHAKYEGYVEKLYVDFTGERVRKGQPLLGIYSPELVAAQKEYLVARGAQARLGDSSVPGVARGGSPLESLAGASLAAAS
jgi:Cu(I)/Ag(I) efflux system membrane fusion protein/cobalt-zinc-cadmium efflux system membrane fusion protein